MNSAVAYVDFPSGETHRFELLNSQWRLKAITSPLGGSIAVDYTYDDNTPPRVTQWTITDGAANRTHYVNFTSSAMTTTDEGGQKVSSVVLQTVGGNLATYNFH